MTVIAIQKIRDPQAVPQSLLDELQSFSDRIRERAYELFQARGCAEGHDMDDWLAAERELTPPAELIEKEREFQARVPVEAAGVREIEVFALPSAIVLRCAKFLQRFDLPRPIDPERAMAKLDKGVLQLVAPKRMQDAVAAA